MNDPLLFHQHNSVHKSNTNRILDTYLYLANLQENTNIIDVGCGDGSVSVEVLFPRFPKTIQKFTLCDVCDNMVSFAKKKYANSKIEVKNLDITTKTLPEEFVQNYDHVFSIALLNWLSEESQLRALKNMFKMLKPGGTVFLIAIGKTAFFDIYEAMAQMDKWKTLTGDYHKYVSLYHYLEKPDEKLKSLLEKSGFYVKLSEVEKCVHNFSNWENCISLCMSVNGYYQNLPTGERDHYVRDFAQALKSHNKVVDTGDKVCLYFNTLVACATKI